MNLWSFSCWMPNKSLPINLKCWSVEKFLCKPRNIELKHSLAHTVADELKFSLKARHNFSSFGVCERIKIIACGESWGILMNGNWPHLQIENSRVGNVYSWHHPNNI